MSPRCDDRIYPVCPACRPEVQYLDPVTSMLPMQQAAVTPRGPPPEPSHEWSGLVVRVHLHEESRPSNFMRVDSHHAMTKTSPFPTPPPPPRPPPSILPAGS